MLTRARTACFSKSPRYGVAAELDYSNLSVENLREIILEVAENKDLLRNMKERSRLYRDQPMKPLERAMWWIEYVIRNPKANHLKSPAVNLNFFVANSLDVFAFFLLYIVVVIFLMYKIIGLCFCKTSEKNRKVDLDKMKKNK